MMHPDLIKLFCDVAEYRSFSRGANANGVTQSAASQRIKGLENELGVQLIDRTKRPLQLTEAGEVYHHGCRDMLDRYEQLRRDVSVAGHQVRGEIKVTAIYSAGIDLLHNVKTIFESNHPKAHVQLNFLHPDAVYDRVSREIDDIGITSFPKRWRDMQIIPLRDEMMVAVCNPKHELAMRSQIDPAELDGQKMVGFEESLPIAKHMAGYFRQHGAHPRVSNVFDNVDTIKTYVAETDTIAILPQRTVHREQERGVLVAIEIQPELVRPLAIIHQKHRALPPVVRVFIEHLLDYQNNKANLTVSQEAVAV